MKYYKKIKSEKGNIFLTPFNENNLELFHEWFTRNDENSRIVFETYKNGISNTISHTRELLNYLNYSVSFLIVNNHNNVIGIVGLENINEIDKTAHLKIQMDTYLQYEKQVYYGNEAVESILKYSFDTLNLNNIIIATPSFNKQLLDIISVSNFQYIGNRTFASKYQNNLFYDKVYYQITKSLFYNKIKPDQKNIISKSKTINDLPYNNLNVNNIIDCEDFLLVKFNELNNYFDDLEECFNNPDISVPLGIYKINWNRIMIEQFLNDTTYIIEKNNTFLGYIHLYNEDKFNHSAELTVMVGNEKYRRQGYAYRALKSFFNEMYKNGTYYNIMSEIYDFNNSSIKLHNKLNFNLIGIQKESYYSNGKLNDTHLYEITKDKYKVKSRK